VLQALDVRQFTRVHAAAGEAPFTLAVTGFLMCFKHKGVVGEISPSPGVHTCTSRHSAR
jgi:hypothetical protein